MTTWTAPRTWAPGGLTSAALNTDVRDNELYLKEVVGGTNADKVVDAALATGITATKLLAVPSVFAYAGGSFVVLNATTTSLFSVNERFDTDTMHSAVTATNTFSIVTAGKYTVGAHVNWPSNATGERIISITSATNGLLVASRLGANGAGPTFQSVVTFYDLGAGDTLTFTCFQSSGGSLTVAGGSAENGIWAFRESA